MHHDSPETPGRHVAPGGWRRGAVGLAVGSLLGLLLTRLLPRDPRDPWVDP